MSGLGYNGTKESPTKSTQSQTKFKMSNQMFQHPRKNNYKNPNRRHRNWRCHYCGRYGNIKPFCFKLYGYPNSTHKSKVTQAQPRK